MYYISFRRIASENSEHKFQAGDVTGVEGGKLMCETRNSSRSMRTEKSREGNPGSRRSGPRGQIRIPVNYGEESGNGETRQRVFARGSGPREGGPREEWYLVKRRARGGTDDRGKFTQKKDSVAKEDEE